MAQKFHLPDKDTLVDPKTGRVTDRWKEFFDRINAFLDAVSFDDLSGTIDLAQLVAHATTHRSGGADAIKLDDLATPDDNTDLDVSTTRHGLCPKLEGSATKFLAADGQWRVP